MNLVSNGKINEIMVNNYIIALLIKNQAKIIKKCEQNTGS